MSIDSTNMSQRVYLSAANETEKYTRLARFNSSAKGSWVFFGLSPLKQPDLEKLLKREISKQNGNGIVNLQIITQQTFMDGFISVITFGLYSLRTMKISGTVVKFNTDMSSIPEGPSYDLNYDDNNNTMIIEFDGLIDEKTLSATLQKLNFNYEEAVR